MMEGYQRHFVKAKIVKESSEEIKRTFASKKIKGKIPDIPGVDNPDLELVKFILASEHENDNGDYFSRSELINSFATPLHKPVDIEHILEESASYISQPLFNSTKNTIIGHMVYSALARKDGTILTDKEISELDTSEDPNREEKDCLDVVAFAVLYKFYFPGTVSDISKLIAKDNIFVSMECWFKGYDFLISGKIVKSTKENFEENNKLWKSGKTIGGRRVCRVLSNVLFGGVGITKTPANEGSVFVKSQANLDLVKLKKRHDELHILQSVNPCKEYEEEHTRIEKIAASLIENNKDKDKDKDEE